MLMEPYEHTCTNCEWVGWFTPYADRKPYNIYLCGKTVLIRQSSEPGDYWSKKAGEGVKGALMIEDSMSAAMNADAHDWPEDFEGENGRYSHECLQCGKPFVGHKHRLTCHVCDDSNKRTWDAMSEVEQQGAMRIFAEAAKQVLGKDTVK